MAKVKIDDNVDRDDIDRIYECMKWANENDPSFPFPAPDPVAARVWIDMIIANREGFMYVVRDVESSEIVGGIAMTPMNIPWNPSCGIVWLHNPWLYIRPKYRKQGSVAAALIKKVIDRAAQIENKAGIRVVPYIMTMWPDKSDEKARFLEMCGMERVGGMFRPK